MLFELDRDLTIETGKLGSVRYAAGAYAYVGSAMKGISARLPHHLRPPKRPHWHIDYVRPKGRPVAIVAVESDLNIECAIAGQLDRRFTVVQGFGASDCWCTGHLFHGVDAGVVLDSVQDMVRAVGGQPIVIAADQAESMPR